MGEERRRHPYKPVNAFDHYLSVSKILLLPIETLSDLDAKAIAKVGELAYASKIEEGQRHLNAMREEAGTYTAHSGEGGD